MALHCNLYCHDNTITNITQSPQASFRCSPPKSRHYLSYALRPLKEV